MKKKAKKGYKRSVYTLQTLLTEHRVEHLTSAPYNPSANGAVERLNRTLTEMLRCELTQGGSWDEKISKVVSNYNNSVHSETKISPVERLRSFKEPVAPPDGPEALNEDWKPGHPSFKSFHEGDLVLKKVHLLGNLCTNKFKARFDGPYTVLKVLGSGVTYVIADPEQRKVKAHHSQIKLFKSAPPYLTEHPAYQKIKEGNKIERFYTYEPNDYYTTEDESDSLDAISTSLELETGMDENSLGQSLLETPTTDLSRTASSMGDSSFNPELTATFLKSFGDIMASFEKILYVDASGLEAAQEQFNRAFEGLNRVLQTSAFGPTPPRHMGNSKPEHWLSTLKFDLADLLDVTNSSLTESSQGTIVPSPTVGSESPSNHVATSNSSTGSGVVLPDEVIPQITNPESREDRDREGILSGSDSELVGHFSPLMELTGVYRHTRSHGAAPHHPNVQPKVLEYRKRSAS